VLSLVNVVGVKEAAGLNIGSDHRPRHAALARNRRIVLVLSPTR